MAPKNKLDNKLKNNKQSPLTANSDLIQILSLIKGKVFLIDHNREVVYPCPDDIQLNEIRAKSAPHPHNDTANTKNEKGKTAKELSQCYKVIFNKDQPCLHCSFSFSEDKLSANDSNKTSAMQIKKNEKRNRDLLLTQSVIFWEGRQWYVDILEEEKNETLYDARDQLTTLGAHVQTIAHELFNPVTGLHLTVQQINKLLGSKDQVYSNELSPLMELLVRDIRRASNVISEIRNYSRPVETSYKFIDLQMVLHSALENVERIYQDKKVKINFSWDLQTDFIIMGNAAKLEQCFVNIFKNSFEMFNPENGAGKEDYQLSISVAKTKDPKIAKIQIIDNAGGISNDALRNVFKPYFTTKEKFRGLGLGLYITANILKEHHSTINIESAQGKTIVTIYMRQSGNLH